MLRVRNAPSPTRTVLIGRFVWMGVTVPESIEKRLVGMITTEVGAMHRRNRWFILASLIYAVAGPLLIVVWSIDPRLIPGEAVRTHVHFMLVGFVGQMIFGVGLHALPRFSGFPLYSERVADAQFVLLNAGLPIMAWGWLGSMQNLAHSGAVAVWAALVCFAINVVGTVRLKGPMG